MDGHDTTTSLIGAGASQSHSSVNLDKIVNLTFSKSLIGQSRPTPPASGRRGGRVSRLVRRHWQQGIHLFTQFEAGFSWWQHLLQMRDFAELTLHMMDNDIHTYEYLTTLRSQ
jgi:hypothetical protein